MRLKWMRRTCCSLAGRVFLCPQIQRGLPPAFAAERRFMQQTIVVLKFGSSVLRSVDDLPAAVHEIYRWYRDGSRILAVISAMGDTTERLLAQARQLAPTPDVHATAQLLATGERASAALLGIALERVGVPARVVDPREIGLMVSGSPLDSEP